MKSMLSKLNINLIVCNFIEIYFSSNNIFFIVKLIPVFKKFIRRSLTTLKYDVENMHRRLDGLEISLEKINNKLSGKSNISAVTYANDEDIVAIENDTDLHKMEDKLTNDPVYRSTVVFRKIMKFLNIIYVTV